MEAWLEQLLVGRATRVRSQLTILISARVKELGIYWTLTR